MVSTVLGRRGTSLFPLMIFLIYIYIHNLLANCIIYIYKTWIAKKLAHLFGFCSFQANIYCMYKSIYIYVHMYITFILIFFRYRHSKYTIYYICVYMLQILIIRTYSIFTTYIRIFILYMSMI